jgi:hypothetical protein
VVPEGHVPAHVADAAAALAEERVFRHLLVEHGAVEWPDGDVGIATEALYALLHNLPKPTGARPGARQRVAGKPS